MLETLNYVTEFQRSTYCTASLNCVVMQLTDINAPERVKSFLHTLNDLDVDVTLGLSQGTHIFTTTM